MAKADRAERNKMSQVPTSPSQTQDAFARLWKEADSSYGHHVEAVEELREQKRREQESPQPIGRRYRKRSSVHDPGASAVQSPSVPVAGRQRPPAERDKPSRPDVVSFQLPMSSLRPDDLSVSALPRSPLGHLKTEAVEEMLRRAAWNYREVLGRNQQLTNQVEYLTQKVEELMSNLGSLEEVAARRKDPDELARALLASAQRAAREERDAARQEAESTLKKARRRAGRIQRDAARRTEQHSDELIRLEKLREDVVTRFRAVLEDLADRYGQHGIEDTELEDAPATAEARQ